jgi:autotransporter-associated beta strand protein
LNAHSDTSEGVTVGGGTITNSGTIQGSIGSPSGNSGTGRGITIAGVDKDANDNPIPPQAPYGATTITNSGLIRGDSDSAIAFTSALASGFSHTITNQAGGLIQTGSATAAAIVTAADNVTISNAGTIDGSSSGKAIAGGSGNLAINITGGSAAVLGDIAGGAGGTNSMTVDPGSGNSFSYSGSISNMNNVAIKSGSTTFSGVSTYTGTTAISGGVLTLNGANRLAAASALSLNGGTLQLANAGGANGQTFSSFSLGDNSLIDLGASSLTFNALGTIAAGKSLNVIDWSASSSPNYAFRLLGDDTANAAFLTLVGDTTIDGQQVAFHFDGTFTDVAPVPIPPAIVMLLSGLGALAVVARRRQPGAAAFG